MLARQAHAGVQLADQAERLHFYEVAITCRRSETVDANGLSSELIHA
jgi:hypothetical protein